LAPEHELPLPLGPLVETQLPSSTSDPVTHAVAVRSLEQAVAYGPQATHSPPSRVKPLAQMEHCRWSVTEAYVGRLAVRLGEAQPGEHVHAEEEEVESVHWPFRQAHPGRRNEVDSSARAKGAAFTMAVVPVVELVRSVAAHWPLPSSPSLHLPVSQWLAQSVA
jgi:hypothetical protein